MSHAVSRLALALLLPRQAFVRDMARTEFDLFALEKIHVNVSARGIAERMCHVSPSWAAVYDQGHRTATYGDGDEEPRQPMSINRVGTLADVYGVPRVWITDGVGPVPPSVVAWGKVGHNGKAA